MHTPPPLPANHRRDQLVRAIRENIRLLIVLVVLAWGIEIFDQFLFGFLDRFGIQPRTLGGLPGILFAPFLHGDFGHLLSNTLPFLALGGVVLIGGRTTFVETSLFVLLVGGGAVWLFGPTATIHIGASLLIFGYLGFLLARGVFEKSLFWVVVSVAMLVVYGGMLRGLFPTDPGVSWQSHLFGFIAGILAARLMFSKKAAN